jgi:hypothetical protein
MTEEQYLDLANAINGATNKRDLDKAFTEAVKRCAKLDASMKQTKWLKGLYETKIKRAMRGKK